MSDDPAQAGQRLDKWLWAARFFKTRSAAQQAVSGGKVHVDGARVKPARLVREGQCLSITRGETTMEVRIEGLRAMRGPAEIAQTLYSETEASRERREAASAERRARRLYREAAAGRPDKHDRRELTRLKRQDY